MNNQAQKKFSLEDDDAVRLDISDNNNFDNFDWNSATPRHRLDIPLTPTLSPGIIMGGFGHILGNNLPTKEEIEQKYKDIMNQVRRNERQTG